jgi:hypothetical protein
MKTMPILLAILLITGCGITRDVEWTATANYQGTSVECGANSSAYGWHQNEAECWVEDAPLLPSDPNAFYKLVNASTELTWEIVPPGQVHASDEGSETVRILNEQGYEVTGTYPFLIWHGGDAQ